MEPSWLLDRWRKRQFELLLRSESVAQLLKKLQQQLVEQLLLQCQLFPCSVVGILATPSGSYGSVPTGYS